MARAALYGEQHRNRRDAEDSRNEHLKKGFGQDFEKIQGNLLGSKPVV